MSLSLRSCLLLLSCLVLFLGLGHAQDGRRDTMATRVRTAIDKGVDYLKGAQKDGNWERDGLGIGRYHGGVSSLALLALLEAGVNPAEEMIVKGLAYLRTVDPKDTYVVGLQTMVFAKADPKRDQLLIKRNADWLRDSLRRDGGGQPIGWGYQKQGGLPGSDNSNTQYAVLGLREADVAGVRVGDEVWKLVQEFYTRTQLQDGGWPYRSDGPRGSTLTMTSAGVCGLLITGMQLYKNQEIIEQDGTIRGCGQFKVNDPLARGLDCLGRNFTVNGGQWRYYNLYGLERAGRLSGQRFFSGGGQAHDWYRAGAEFLLNQQNAIGSWRSDSPLDGNPIISTSFALLFLSKGKTPVLIHKMLHGRGQLGGRGLVGDWNNDRNDARNLTEYCSQKVFFKNGRPVPLTWQAFDASKLNAADPQSVAEMLQAPILYVTGHLPPYFTDGEKHLLKQYVDQGGFIVAEACCGRMEFDRGIRQLMQELWPDRKLEPLPPGHPIWSAFKPLPPGTFKLEGIDFGCKTCVVYSPQDLSCYWETNRFEGKEDDRAVLAFQMGGNIVAYATGLEPPEDKLTVKEVVVDRPEVIRRNFLQVAQIDYGGRDWQPAPKAMRNLMNHVQKEWNVDVILQTKALRLGDPNLSDYKFLYMHGRRNFGVLPEHQKLLRQHLEHGGLLLADACCGHPAFDESFRAMMRETFGPDRKLEPIKLDDPLFTDRIGKPIQTVRCRTKGGSPHTQMAPQLEGVRLDPKNLKSPWIVIYSKYDLGCALDKHDSPDCLGHTHDSALDLAAQAVLYALKE